MPKINQLIRSLFNPMSNFLTYHAESIFIDRKSDIELLHNLPGTPSIIQVLLWTPNSAGISGTEHFLYPSFDHSDSSVNYWLDNEKIYLRNSSYHPVYVTITALYILATG